MSRISQEEQVRLVQLFPLPSVQAVPTATLATGPTTVSYLSFSLLQSTDQQMSAPL